MTLPTTSLPTFDEMVDDALRRGELLRQEDPLQEGIRALYGRGRGEVEQKGDEFYLALRIVSDPTLPLEGYYDEYRKDLYSHMFTTTTNTTGGTTVSLSFAPQRQTIDGLSTALLSQVRRIFPGYQVEIVKPHETTNPPDSLEGVRQLKLRMMKLDDGRTKVECMNVLELSVMSDKELAAELNQKIRAAEDFAAAQQIEAFTKSFTQRMKRFGFSKYRIEPYDCHNGTLLLFVQGSRSGDSYVQCGQLGAILQQSDEALKSHILGKIEQARVGRGY